MSAPSDLDQLLAMGFDQERAEIAVKQTGGLNGAIEWLEQNQDRSLDEIKASTAENSKTVGESSNSDPVAKSWTCNECGKKFRDQAGMSFHASKSGHVDFDESVEEIAPLTEEEKKAKLEELRQRLKSKREAGDEQDKIDRKRNEQIRMKSTKETQDIKEELQKKAQIQEAQKKRAEKQADIEAKAKIKAQIEADKQARRDKAEKEKAAREGRAAVLASSSEAAAPTTSGPVASKPASAYTETRLRLQTGGGNVMKSFPVETTLFEVAAALESESGVKAQSFVQNFPKKIFDSVDFGSTLKELGLVPSASLIVR